MARQGEIWWAEAEDKRRPVLVVTRSQAAEVLRNVVVAPITKTIRGIPTELPVGTAHGLPVESVASFDNLRVLPRSMLTTRLGSLSPADRWRLCAALTALADC